jgi:hypothetical protein
MKAHLPEVRVEERKPAPRTDASTLWISTYEKAAQSGEFG